MSELIAYGSRGLQYFKGQNEIKQVLVKVHQHLQINL